MIQIEMPKRNQQLQTSESLIHFGHKHGRQAAMSLRAPSVRVSVSGVLFCFGEVKLRLWLFSFWVYFLGLLKVNSTIKIWFGSHCVSWLRVVFFFLKYTQSRTTLLMVFCNWGDRKYLEIVSLVFVELMPSICGISNTGRWWRLRVFWYYQVNCTSIDISKSALCSWKAIEDFHRNDILN